MLFKLPGVMPGGLYHLGYVIKMIYEWSWQKEGDEKFLFVKFNKTQTFQDCLKCFAEALADFDGGYLKVLGDLRLSENTIGYNEEMAIIYDNVLNMGVEKGVVSLIVSDKSYYFKEKIVNEFLKINKQPFFTKSFMDYDMARKWLVDFSFSLT